MNSRYWRTTLIKLLNLTNSVYNFSNNDSETEKSDIKTTYWGGEDKGFKTCSHVSTWVDKQRWHKSA